jgi:hypothetical protein
MFATARALVLADEIKSFVPLCEKTLNDSPNPVCGHFLWRQALRDL